MMSKLSKNRRSSSTDVGSGWESHMATSELLVANPEDSFHNDVLHRYSRTERDYP